VVVSRNNSTKSETSNQALSIVRPTTGCVNNIFTSIFLPLFISQCAHCSSETELYDGGTPVCLKCSEERSGRRECESPDKRNVRANGKAGACVGERTRGRSTMAFYLRCRYAPGGART